MLSVLVLFIGTLAAQTNVSGKVTDEKGEPMVGATIVVKGTTVGAVTEVDGSYSVAVPINSTNTLNINNNLFSY